MATSASPHGASHASGGAGSVYEAGDVLPLLGWGTLARSGSNPPLPSPLHHRAASFSTWSAVGMGLQGHVLSTLLSLTSALTPVSNLGLSYCTWPLSRCTASFGTFALCKAAPHVRTPQGHVVLSGNLKCCCVQAARVSPSSVQRSPPSSRYLHFIASASASIRPKPL